MGGESVVKAAAPEISLSDLASEKGRVSVLNEKNIKKASSQELS